MRLPAVLPEEIEAYRDRMWRREVDLRIEDARAAEDFINTVGFCSALTDIRRPGPSLYVAVCGRRDARIPRNVQTDPETSLAWTIKDHVMRQGRVYYGKMIKGRATFIARPLVPFFNALWGIPWQKERTALSPDALAVLKVLRREWEMATQDLRVESGVRERPRFNKALDELQRKLKVIPSDVTYEPTFTYIWSVAEARFPEELNRKVERQDALTEIARAYLKGAGMSNRGELARVTGLSAPEAGLGNWALVDEQFADRLAPGVYRLRNSQWSVSADYADYADPNNLFKSA
jgi:hypothetical protein